MLNISILGKVGMAWSKLSRDGDGWKSHGLWGEQLDHEPQLFYLFPV